MLFIISRDMEVLTVASNTGKGMPYFSDNHIQILEQGTESYEFTVPTQAPESQHIQGGNYVVRTDKDGNHLMFTIMEVTESHSVGEEVKQVYCESAGLELLNEGAEPYKATEQKTLEFYVKQTTAGTGWNIGILESNSKLTLEFTEHETALARLQKIASSFEVELHFTVNFDGTVIKKKLIHLEDKRGNNTGKRFTYGKDITGIKRIESLNNISTALHGVGKANDKGVFANFKDLTFDDGDLYTVAGSPKLYSRSALERWGQQGGNIHNFFTYETASASELLNRTKTALKKAIVPEVTYELEVMLLESLAGYEHEKVRIGDTIKVVDTTFTPELYLEARILQLDTSYVDPSQDKCVLGNFKLVKSSISASLKSLESKLLQKEASWDEISTAIDQLGTMSDQVSVIDDRTSPSAIVETVINNESFDSILSNKANVEDLSDMATGEQLLELKDNTTDYINTKIDGEGGVNESINAVNTELIKATTEINEKFTAGGGVNLIRNSIGFGGKDFWLVNGTVNSYQNQELEQLGYGSGWYSSLGTAGYIEQTIPTAKDDIYTLSFMIKKFNDNVDPINGSVGVEIYAGDTKLAFLGKQGGQGITAGYELASYTFSTNLTEVQIRVTFGSAIEGIITGLMFNTGSTAYQWVSHTEELYTTTIQVNSNGLKVVGLGGKNYVTISPIEFAGYSVTLDENNNPTMTRVFTLNGEVTEVSKLSIDKELSMQTMKIIPINTTSNKGWAFLPIT